MTSTSPLRLLLALVLLLGLLLGTLFVFVITDYAYSVRDHLQAGPGWFAVGYLVAGGVLIGLALWFIYRVLFPRRSQPESEDIAAIDETTLNDKLEQSAEQGIDIALAERELAALHQRRDSGEIHIALLGEINAGKSSLVRALLPDAEVQISPRGGATRDITRYQWTSPAGDRLILTDLPGLNEVDGSEHQHAREEAIRAHVVIYVCDGDLTRDQFEEVSALRQLQKPTIIALNKIDQLTPNQQTQLEQRLQQRLSEQQDQDLRPVDIVSISSGGQEEVIRLLPDGSEQRLLRDRGTHITPLTQALQKRLDQDEAGLEQLRDAAVFVLVKRKLDTEVQAHRQTQGDAIVTNYTRKAVVGAMAAVAPGTDMLIQGYLGINLVRDLCELHQVPAKQIDIDRYLSLVGKQLGKTLPLLLAIAGNALKAFPGLGTLGGGLLHAVAYGLIFDSLGRAVIATLESRGALRPVPTVRHFEDSITKNLGTRSKALAQMLLEEKKRHD